jgi:hypothetical protein
MKTGYTGKPVEATHAPSSSPVNLLAEGKRPVVTREVKSASSIALTTLVMCSIVTILVMCL